MKINRLVIENFKSIERIELIEPNPFTVFVGPNGSGKSNIFEALEFVNLSRKGYEVRSLFGGPGNYLRRQRDQDRFYYQIDFETVTLRNTFAEGIEGLKLLTQAKDDALFVTKDEQRQTFEENESEVYYQFVNNFARIFIKNNLLVKLIFRGNVRLSLDADNIEAVLKRILLNDVSKNEIFEWLELFVPEFKAVEVDDRNELHWFERYSSEYFTKDLISDGTYNILAMLTAVYQSDEPQFLCIEEPENGLHPQVLMSLVDFFRKQCEEKGHYIWLNTHSESLVRGLTSDEIILVNKQNGATQTKQIKGRNLYDLPTDEAWLTGALGGGLPW